MSIETRDEPPNAAFEHFNFTDQKADRSLLQIARPASRANTSVAE